MKRIFLPQRLFPFFIFFVCHITLNAADLPPGFAEVLIAQNLNPVAMTIDHHGRIWLAEKDGRVLIIDENGQVQSDPFITLQVDDENERGLLGIALHPDMDQHPYVYLYYTVPFANHNRLSRFRANGDLALPGSEEILLELDQLSGKVHNGGAMLFDHQEKLLIATGEAAFSPNAQNLDNLLGKILRLNADGSIPTDNPFYQQLDGNNRAIYAYGLRNPFSMAFDPVEKKILVNDVGAGNYEEVNEIIAGKNYGWPLIEGPIDNQIPPDNYQDPLFAYNHDQGCAIVGAAFYRSKLSHFPANYQGNYFYADYCSGDIHMLNPETGQSLATFATHINRPLAILVDPHSGELYYLARAGLGGGSNQDNTSSRDGTLWKVFYQGNGRPFISVQPQPTLVSVGDSAVFTVRASGSIPLSFQWHQNGIIVPDAVKSTLILENVTLADDQSTYFCIVSNQFGADTSNSAMLSATVNQRPIPLITMPIHSNRFHAGDTIRFKGSATDPEQGVLSDTALSWQVDWHHANHTHPSLGPINGISDGYWVVPLVNETDPEVWYRIYLTATDNEGLSQTTYVEIFPEINQHFITGKSGIELNLDGQLLKLPITYESMIGLQRTLVAPAVFNGEDSIFLFKKWGDDNNDLRRIFYTPEKPDTLEVIYEGFALGDGEGLLGEYFVDPEFDLDGEPVLVRQDAQVDFKWGNNSPDNDLLPVDGFTVRWTGEVQAIFSESLSFITHSDDGVRLWVNDSLLIDQWGPQSATEHQGDIVLEANKRYQIRLEYLEIAGGAQISLFWESPRINREIIPSRQLYLPAAKSKLSGEIWLDENRNDFYDIEENPIENLTLVLYDRDTTFIAATTTQLDGNFTFSELKADDYFLQGLSLSTGLQLEPGTGFEADETTPFFRLIPGEEKRLFLSYYPIFSTSTTEMQSMGLGNIGLYPNPVREQLQINMYATINQKGKVQIIDALGRRITQQVIEIRVGENRPTINVTGLASGFYLLSLETPFGKQVRRFIKRGF